MKLKVGDVIEFKKYEDMNDVERIMLGEDAFTSFGTVSKVINGLDVFSIEGESFYFSFESVARVISNADINELNIGDEVLVKSTVKTVFDGFIQINPLVDKEDITKILKRKEPEIFIVKENHYNMYIGAERGLVSDTDRAKFYKSRGAANKEANSMHLNAWNVIPYGD